MIPLSEARDLILRQTQPVQAVSCELDRAFGCVLRADVHAPEDSPAFDRSAMDGYALGEPDGSGKFRVTGEITPGRLSDLVLSPGTCVRIFTGAAVPAGAGRVVPQENARREGDWIYPEQISGQNFIRRRGEDVRAGDLILEAGTRLRGPELSILAHHGIATPLISDAVRVAHFATGDELIPPDTTPAPGQIRDTNSVLVKALVEQTGGTIVSQERIGDSADKLQHAISAALGGCDLVLISGGASVGDYDFGPRVLEQLGFTIVFRQLDLRPGKPLVFATRGTHAAFVIPGNPVSHFVTFHVAVRAAIERLLGAQPQWRMVRLPLAEPIRAQRDARETYWPGRLLLDSGTLAVKPVNWQSSGDLSSLAGVDVLIRLAGRSEARDAGAEASVLLLRD